MHLSGGNKRKLCFAMVMIQNPNILLLDEALSGLDPVARRKILLHLRELEKTSTLLISHKAEEIEDFSHQIAILVGGQIREMGTPLDLRAKLA